MLKYTINNWKPCNYLNIIHIYMVLSSFSIVIFGRVRKEIRFYYDILLSACVANLIFIFDILIEYICVVILYS